MTRPTLVLLPGLLCDRAVWQAQCDALDLADCVVPTYGKLSSLTDMAGHVLATVTSDRFALAGHSMGGRVALEVLRLAPHRVDRIALMDTGLDPIAPGSAGDQERDLRHGLLEIARNDGMRAMAVKWATGMVHPDRLDEPVFESVLAMIERATPDIFEAQIQALLARPDARPGFAAIACPTLIACGRQDAWSPLARHVEMQRLLPAARLVVIEDAGHMAPMERPEGVNRAMRDWLLEQPMPAAPALRV